MKPASLKRQMEKREIQIIELWCIKKMNQRNIKLYMEHTKRITALKNC